MHLPDSWQHTDVPSATDRCLVCAEAGKEDSRPFHTGRSDHREDFLVAFVACLVLLLRNGSSDIEKVQVTRHEKVLSQVLSGRSDKNLPFSSLRQLLLHLGFEERTRGSHHIFRKAGIEEKINLQKDRHEAKPYQVRQVREVILRYKLGDKC